jgi:hypothetical protein
MEKEDIAWRSVAMKLNNYHASVLDSCPPLPKASEQEGDNSLNTRFQQYYLDGISQDQLQFLNNYCTPSSTDDIDAKMSRTVDSLEAKVWETDGLMRITVVYDLMADRFFFF